MAHKINIKPVTKEEVKKITQEMKEVVTTVSRKVAESMRHCESSAAVYVKSVKKN
jgi:hypothetical protein